MDVESTCAAPVAESPRALARWGKSHVAELPAGVADILHQRGVTAGAVLLLADHPPRPQPPTGDPAGLQVSIGALTDAAALVDGREVAALVVRLEAPDSHEVESRLAPITTRLVAGTLLVLVLPATGFRHRGAPIDREQLHLSLLRAGYDRVWVHTDRRSPCISATRAATKAVRTCSIIVPVYNEQATFPELMRALLAKRLDHLGLEREIILIESNSTDGTREQVASFAATPGVKILWEDRARGKGHAVRAGLGVATGDIVLIQDADLEYDLNDYDALLEPLLQGRAAFVLGCRHNGRLRMRKFTDQWLLGEVLNAAHLLLRTLINVLYGQNMKDPFTMFKVFRRDCLYGLQFECNRFDFDHELVIKLVLKGYRPLEIPVNYCSRSFKQGKKIRLFRDPPGLIAADLKYRLQRLRPHLE
jgi:hypothetical protein